MQGKKYRAFVEKLEKDKVYTPAEAFLLIAENPIAKFDETVEVHVRLAIDPKKGDQQIRGSVVLPHGTGKESKIAVITATAADEAKKAGADFVGDESAIADIKSGKFFEAGYDVLVATPEMMPKLAPVAKILGPKGMMPSPKSETVTTKIADTVSMLKKGKVSYKNDNTSNLHQAIGKVSFGADKLVENYAMLIESLQKNKPSSVKGKFITSVSVCSTMSPGIQVSL